MIDSQERESQVAASAKQAAIAKTQPKVAPVAKATPVIEGESNQLDGAGSSEVARDRTGSPRRTVGVAANLETVITAEVYTTGERDPPRPELGPVYRLGKDEIDLAGTNSVETHWFWELLKEVGYDVW